MEEIGKLLMLLSALAFLVEAVVEVVVSPLLKRVIPDDKIDMRVAIIRLVISVTGAVITLAYKLDLLAKVMEIFGAEPPSAVAAQVIGRILTGLLIGRGAQWFHDIGGTWLGLDGKLLKRITLPFPALEKGQEQAPTGGQSESLAPLPSPPQEVALSNKAQLAELVQQSVAYVDQLGPRDKLTVDKVDIAGAFVVTEVTKRGLGVTTDQIASAVRAVFDQDS